MKIKIAKICVSSAQYFMDKPYDYRIPDSMNSAEPGMRVMVPFGRGNRRSEGIILKVMEYTGDRTLKCIDSVLDETPVLSPRQIQLALWMRERFFCTVFDAVKAMLPAGLWYRLKCTYSLAEGITAEKAYEAAGKSQAARNFLDVLYAHGGSVAEEDLALAMAKEDISAAFKKLSASGIAEKTEQEVRRVRDKTASVAVLKISAEEAMETVTAKRRSSPLQASVLEMLALMGEAEIKEITYFTGASRAVVNNLAKKGIVEIEQREMFRRPKHEAPGGRQEIILNEEQRNAFYRLRELLHGEKAEAALLYGVTGSGKTSVYIKIIEEALKMGKQAVMLVPEIGLTPQFVSAFTAYFGENNIAVLHSSLSTGERYDEWKRIRSGNVNVVIGTRSAVFAPVQRLGVIIIDEEQEHTYKSENSPRYHARDVAKYLCAHSNALLLMGSATPAVESMYSARTGRYKYLRLEKRYNKMPMPEVITADMRQELKNGNGGAISSVLKNELSRNIKNGEQSILFINRRGASNLVLCGECGHTFGCPNCSVSLTYHSANRRFMCHYCGYSEPAAKSCPSCGGILKFAGMGTQLVEEELKKLFPDTEILRMDMDTVSQVNSHEKILKKFRDRRIPILLGTQMVTKGLNFENVTLVGVISADQYLYANDYRANEKTFSLITQVIGRAGRGDKPGRAVIQTYTPQNQIIRLAASQDYDGFFSAEIEIRKLMLCPPVCDILRITAVGLQESVVLSCCRGIRKRLMEYENGFGLRILGPVPAVVVRVNNRYRYNITISGNIDKQIREIVSYIICEFSKERNFRGVSLFADMNPVS